mmetsp:Transcript_949/g.3500  ORF Transcript_949/g.3500 Transcript_949/m.3500 type:complete len:252 (+) Transcript_949:614-1369(+)
MCSNDDGLYDCTLFAVCKLRLDFAEHQHVIRGCFRTRSSVGNAVLDANRRHLSCYSRHTRSQRLGWLVSFTRGAHQPSQQSYIWMQDAIFQANDDQTPHAFHERLLLETHVHRHPTRSHGATSTNILLQRRLDDTRLHGAWILMMTHITDDATIFERETHRALLYWTVVVALIEICHKLHRSRTRLAVGKFFINSHRPRPRGLRCKRRILTNHRHPSIVRVIVRQRKHARALAFALRLHHARKRVPTPFRS